jgi:hypothetical protein
MRHSLPHLLRIQRVIYVAIPSLLVFLSGCVTATEPHTGSYSKITAGRLSESSFPETSLPLEKSSTSSSIRPAGAIHLVSDHSNDPAWLTGDIKFETGQTLTSPDVRQIQTGLSASLDPVNPLPNSSSFRLSSHSGDGEFDSNLFFDDSPPVVEPSFLSRIASDHRYFYSPDSLIGLSYGLAGGALMANTNFDNTMQAHFQASIRNAGSDEWFHTLEAQKKLGNGHYTIPVFAIAWAAGSLLEGDPVADNVGEWGERSIRSILVGAPPMLATQYIVGGSRPGESTAGSDWKLFQDHNGVSGHSFMGAIPFLTAAQMAEEPWIKFAFYAGSTLVPLSRINDDDHYTSQAFLGWWFALLATKAIDSTQQGYTNWALAPWLGRGTSGFAAEYRF